MRDAADFKDYFSGHANDYARYRPRYPATLFAYLAGLPAQHECAWDCATGNGQAALGLVPFFERVLATDASQSQLESAERHEKITYSVAKAEHTEFEEGSIDLVTVAQALHWFDIEAFYAEVRRVLKHGGVFAVWVYNLLEISPAIDEPINRFYGETMGPYWPPERELIEKEYRSITFPFSEFQPPSFRMEASWSLFDLTGYLRTWSATKGFIKAHGFDPVAELTEELLPLWGSPDEPKQIRWPLILRVGVKE